MVLLVEVQVLEAYSKGSGGLGLHYRALPGQQDGRGFELRAEGDDVAGLEKVVGLAGTFAVVMSTGSRTTELFTGDAYASAHN